MPEYSVMTTSDASWSLPSSYGTSELESVADITGDDPTWALLDLDGDGALDLVCTEWASSGISTLGTSLWLWHANTGAGFSTSAASWSLPSAYGAAEYESIGDINGDDPAWTLLDLDADGQVELVVTEYASSGSATLGTSAWWVHDNTWSGFDSSAAAWALPSGWPTAELDHSYDDTSTSQPYWSLLDLDGGGAVDLVLTRWDSTGISGLGSTQWVWEHVRIAQGGPSGRLWLQNGALGPRGGPSGRLWLQNGALGPRGGPSGRLWLQNGALGPRGGPSGRLWLQNGALGPRGGPSGRLWLQSGALGPP